MVRYSLRCDKGHEFESWFASATAYDALSDAGRIECPVCGSTQVEKALMAPGIRSAEPSASLAVPQSERERAIARLRDEVEKSSHYVGRDFAAEARAIHLGEKPTRSIWGEARPEEAKALVEDGVPVAPLPFRPRAKTN